MCAGELRAMIAKLDADAQETAAFTDLNACTDGLTCASSSTTSLDDETFDCGSDDLVSSPETVMCGQACSAAECCVVHALESAAPADPSDTEAAAQGQAVLDSIAIAPILGCEMFDGEEEERCEGCPLPEMWF